MDEKKYKKFAHNKNTSNFILLSKFGADYLRKKMEQISANIAPENFFEKISKKMFKRLYEKNAQKIALSKFSEINKIAQEISEIKK